VITEIQMPDLAGMNVVEALDRLDPDTPVILMSTGEESEASRARIGGGALYHIRKPVIAAELLAACRMAVETRHLKSKLRLLRHQLSTGAAPAVAEPLFPVEPGVSGERRPERAAIERAARARVGQFMSEAIAKAPTRLLERALSEPTGPEVLADVVAGVLLDDSIEGQWAAALLRGARVQRALLDEAGGALSAADVGELLGIGRAAVDKRRRHGSLLALKLPSGDVVYPAAQFGPRDVVPGLPEVLAEFRIRDPWMQLDLLLARPEVLGGRTGFEALAAGDDQKVRQLVASVGEQGL
jgi:CheY-like chemotaxis protein